MVWLVNTCHWINCGKTFSSTEDLIQHVEEFHIDSETSSFVSGGQDGQRPSTIHLSHVSRFFSEEALAKRKYSSMAQCGSENAGVSVHRPSVAPTSVRKGIPMAVSTGLNGMNVASSSSPTDSGVSSGSATRDGSPSVLMRKRCKSESHARADAEDFDDLDDGSLSDTGSFHTSDEESSPPVASRPTIRMSEVMLRSIKMDDNSEKPYMCLVPGCGKRYKNPNGIKYHALHGHALPGDSRLKKTARFVRCEICGKRYKNTTGLRNHVSVMHPTEGIEQAVRQMANVKCSIPAC